MCPVSLGDQCEEEEEAFGTGGAGLRDGTIGAPCHHLCWLNSCREETGIPVTGSVGRQGCGGLAVMRLGLCFRKPVVWRRSLLWFLFFSEPGGAPADLDQRVLQEQKNRQTPP